MKEKINNIITIAIFLIMIILIPLTFYMFKDKIPVINTENRELYTKPELQLSTLTEFPKSYDNYYNDHAPFRTQFNQLWSILNYKLFKVSTSDSVLVGKEDWLFYDVKSDGNPIGQLQYSREELNINQEKILESLINVQENLKNKNIEFYYLLIPNKERVYKELLPDYIKVRESNPILEVKDYIEENSKINVLYLEESLLNAKQEKDIYYKYDTHWNRYGAFLGTVELLKKMNPNLNIGEYNITEINKFGGDLANMIGINEYLDNDVDYEINLLDVNMSYDKEKNEALTITTNKDAKIKKNLLVIGDSFSERMEQYLSSFYEKVVYVHVLDYKKNMLADYQINTVVFESVERYINRIEGFDI